MAEIVGGYMEKENVTFIKKHVPTKVNDSVGEYSITVGERDEMNKILFVRNEY